MKIEALAVPDAWSLTPVEHRDSRGGFLEWFRSDLLTAATGRRFAVVQANHSVSRRGVVRGVHFSDVPPGQAKLVYCPVGAVLDVVVDIRVGSPTFGAVDSVVLDDVAHRAVFVSEGLGHAFCALRDDSSATYLVSSGFNPATEHTVSALDPSIAALWPFDADDLVLSDKDAAAPSLDAAARAGLLPDFAAVTARYAELRCD